MILRNHRRDYYACQYSGLVLFQQMLFFFYFIRRNMISAEQADSHYSNFKGKKFKLKCTRVRLILNSHN